MKKLNFSQDVTKILRSFTKEISGDLDANLVGIYLFGSLTYNDFNPKRSDIDLVVILQKPVTAKKLAQIKKLRKRKPELEKTNRVFIFASQNAKKYFAAQRISPLLW